MLQLDLIDKNNESYLFSEIQKMRTSMDRQQEAMFAFMTELQDEILKLKREKEND